MKGTPICLQGGGCCIASSRLVTIEEAVLSLVGQRLYGPFSCNIDYRKVAILSVGKDLSPGIIKIGDGRQPSLSQQRVINAPYICESLYRMIDFLVPTSCEILRHLQDCTHITIQYSNCFLSVTRKRKLFSPSLF